MSDLPAPPPAALNAPQVAPLQLSGVRKYYGKGVAFPPLPRSTAGEGTGSAAPGVS